VIALDAADLVVIAGRTLGIGTDAALDQLDIAAAQHALAEARPPGAKFAGRATAATAGAGLVLALLRHRPFPGHAQQVAVAAGLQFLSLNGWRADLNPPATAAVVVEALASGRLAPGDAAAWLAPRLSRARRAVRAPARSGRGLPVPLPSARVPAGRALAGAVLAVAVTGVTLLAAACSRGPDLPAVPAGGLPAVHASPGSTPRPADSAYAACIRSHGVASFAYPAASDVAVPVIGIGLGSAKFSAAEVACQW
jgi:prophage maintenance system killer protein